MIIDYLNATWQPKQQKETALNLVGVRRGLTPSKLVLLAVDQDPGNNRVTF